MKAGTAVAAAAIVAMLSVAPIATAQRRIATAEQSDTSNSSASTNGRSALTVQHSDEYGSYVADADGRALYMYTKDQQQKGDTPAEAHCGIICSNAWPPFSVEKKPEIGSGLDASLVGMIEGHGGKMQVTYAGWPLYYYEKDDGPGSVEGQGDDREWYLLTPDGKMNLKGVAEGAKEQKEK
jgi:predicted lipoprotein with Yx(FWY)xxD motif